jgi:hypothetical protein
MFGRVADRPTGVQVEVQVTQCALRPSDLKTGGGLANLMCEHAYPRVIRENHWSCCGSTEKYSTHCEKRDVDVTPKRSDSHRGEYRDAQVTHQHWCGFFSVFSSSFSAASPASSLLCV